MDNIGLRFSLIILIILLLYCNISKYLNHLKNNNNNNKNNRNITDQFEDTNSVINYLKNPRCDNENYCPNKHPNIPCNLLDKCSKKEDSLEQIELEKNLLHYAYLNALLTDIDNKNLYYPNQNLSEYRYE